MPRPKLKIDWNKFETLCAIQCTQIEIADQLGVHPDTLAKRVKQEYNLCFSEVFRQKRTKGYSSLRGKQYEIAMAGNVTMLIWLGKQYLGQSDQVKTTIDIDEYNFIEEDAP